VIQRFNFYDIYGYLIPGTLLLGILWLPVGLIMKSVPEQDFSKAFFLAALAYFAGHLLRAVSTVVVPSQVRDAKLRLRAPSELILDPGVNKSGQEFVDRLQEQVLKLFGICLHVEAEGDGKGEISRGRNTAFFQARAYLIAKKTAAYVEQFEGMYSMMRGLGCAMSVGVAYFGGWWIYGCSRAAALAVAMAALTAVAVCGTAWFALPPRHNVPSPTEAQKHRTRIVTASLWLLTFVALGFWLGSAAQDHFGHTLTANGRHVLLAGMAVLLLAALKCFSAYREFAQNFAETVWRDFSACVSFGSASEANSGKTTEETEE